MADLFAQLQAEAAALNLQVMPALQRIRTLMHATQVRTLPVDGRRFEWQPSGLMVTGTRDEGMLVILDHPYVSAEAEIRVCRGCGCTDIKHCLVLGQPCSWRAFYGDGTALCSCCDDNGVQPPLFPEIAGSGAHPPAAEPHPVLPAESGLITTRFEP